MTDLVLVLIPGMAMVGWILGWYVGRREGYLKGQIEAYERVDDELSEVLDD